MLTNLIESAISSSNSTQVECLRSQLESTYQEFLTIHYDFLEYVSSDESMEDIAYVNKMSPVEYYQAVKASYDKAISDCNTWHSKFYKIKHSLILAIKKANGLVADCTDNTFITEHHRKCVALSESLADTIGFSDLLLETK